MSANVAPALPPVDTATAERAASEIAASPMPSATTDSVSTTRSFIAPAPLGIAPSTSVPLDTAASDPQSLGIAPLPEVSHAVAAPEPLGSVNPLSDETKKILSIVPSQLNTPKSKPAKLAVDRMSPDLKLLEKTAQKVETYDSSGLSIKVQRPGLDTNFELNRAYTALMGGDTALAISSYKNILSTEPSNEDALFGLAATYHRLGELLQARPYYGRLLKANPNHREGLNNFLALVSEESPQEALAELERLEQRNPDFSPIPAQQAVVLNKLGFADQARDKMLRAIELAPENLTYKYNLAVLLDKNGRYAEAFPLYRMLIDASLKGEKIPASTEILQKRLNFIAATAAPTAAVGG